MSSIRFRNSGAKVCSSALRYSHRGVAEAVALFDTVLNYLHRFLDHVARPDVRGHDDDRVAEVHLAARAVGEVSLVEDLQQGVEDFGVGFLDFVEQDDRIGMAAYRFGELSAFAVADISRRGADQPCDVVFFAVFAHVDTDESLVLVEEPFGELFRQQGFAHARRSDEHEDADRTPFVLESRPGSVGSTAKSFRRLRIGR